MFVLKPLVSISPVAFSLCALSLQTFVRNIAAAACSSVGIRNCHRLRKVKVGGGVYSKEDWGGSEENVFLPFVFFSGLPLRLVTA